MRVVLNAIIFLELSNEDVVDQRSAVKMLEYTAYQLRKLSSEDRKAFLDYARLMAEEEYQPQVRELLLSLDTTMLPDDEDDGG